MYMYNVFEYCNIHTCISTPPIQVFTSVALFNILISPLNAFPWVINGLVEAWVSTKRVQQFLQLEEMDWSHYYLGYHSGTAESRLLMCSTQPLHEL